jgi:hypothetical protein
MLSLIQFMYTIAHLLTCTQGFKFETMYVNSHFPTSFYANEKHVLYDICNTLFLIFVHVSIT